MEAQGGLDERGRARRVPDVPDVGLDCAHGDTLVALDVGRGRGGLVVLLILLVVGGAAAAKGLRQLLELAGVQLGVTVRRELDVVDVGGREPAGRGLDGGGCGLGDGRAARHGADRGVDFARLVVLASGKREGAPRRGRARPRVAVVQAAQHQGAAAFADEKSVGAAVERRAWRALRGELVAARFQVERLCRAAEVDAGDDGSVHVARQEEFARDVECAEHTVAALGHGEGRARKPPLGRDACGDEVSDVRDVRRGRADAVHVGHGPLALFGGHIVAEALAQRHAGAVAVQLHFGAEAPR